MCDVPVTENGRWMTFLDFGIAKHIQHAVFRLKVFCIVSTVAHMEYPYYWLHFISIFLIMCKGLQSFMMARGFIFAWSETRQRKRASVRHFQCNMFVQAYWLDDITKTYRVLIFTLNYSKPSHWLQCRYGLITRLVAQQAKACLLIELVCEAINGHVDKVNNTSWEGETFLTKRRFHGDPWGLT